MDELFNAWLAGFYEGEGDIAVVNIRYLQVRLKQKETSLLRKIQQELGFGSVTSRYNGGFRISCFVCCGKNAISLLKRIFPYMRSKRRIAQMNRALKRTNYGKSR